MSEDPEKLKRLREVLSNYMESDQRVANQADTYLTYHKRIPLFKKGQVVPYHDQHFKIVDIREAWGPNMYVPMLEGVPSRAPYGYDYLVIDIETRKEDQLTGVDLESWDQPRGPGWRKPGRIGHSEE